MANIKNITDWTSDDSDLVTIGKRVKKVVYHPRTLEEYYFKEPKTDFPWEFWTEIVAYEIGKAFGFNVLKYIPAQFENNAGCLSRNMIDGTETLIHGQQFLLRIKPDFEIDRGIDHTFQIVDAFFGLDWRFVHMRRDFIEMLIFDALIGNRDRHQQNWAAIHQINLQLLVRHQMKYSEYTRNNKKSPYRFSPLFDNGNCLAYNILEENLEVYLTNEQKLNKYLFGRNAVSHVRWEDKQITHMDLMENIAKLYPKEVAVVINRMRQLSAQINIEEIVRHVDHGAIFAHPRYNLSDKRKALMTMLLQKRLQKILEVL